MATVADGLDLDEAAGAVYGMPVGTFLALAFGVYSQAIADGITRIEQTIFGNVRDPKLQKLRAAATPENVECFWSLIATDYLGFRALCDEFTVPPAYAR